MATPMMIPPGTRVLITELENGKGIVIGVLSELGGTTYNVRYWHNGEAKTAWLTRGEIVTIDPVMPRRDRLPPIRAQDG